MKNKEKLISNYDSFGEDIFSSGSAAILEKEDTELDIYPDLLIDGSDGNLTVVIHHDYYSSNTDHGKILLKAFLEVLKDEFSKISRIYLIDSGVCLLDESNFLYDTFAQLLELDFDVVACSESMDNFRISSKLLNIRLSSMHDIALELLSSPYLINLG